MSHLEPRARLFFRVFVVGLSAMIFACGGDAPIREEPLRAAFPGAKPSPPEPLDPPATASAPDPAPAMPPRPGQAEAEPTRAPGTDSEPPLPAAAGEQDSEIPRPRQGDQGSDGTRVFTNDDLKPYARVKEQFGFRDGEVVVDLSRGDQAPSLPETEDVVSSLTRAEIDAEIAATRAAVASLTDEVAYLENRIPSLHNPFLPRVAPSEADGIAEAGMDNAEKLARVNDRLAAARGDLAAASRRLADLYNLEPAGAPPSPDGGRN